MSLFNDGKTSALLLAIKVLIEAHPNSERLREAMRTVLGAAAGEIDEADYREGFEDVLNFLTSAIEPEPAS